MDKVKSYRDRPVWQRAVELAVHIYRSTESFPKTEIYALTNQLRRAAVSIASKIAEGYGRSEAELAGYLTMARGSLAELETQAETAKRIGDLSDKNHAELSEEFNTLGRQ